VQGYNVQAVIDAGKSGLIVGAHLSDAPNDSNQLAPALAAVAPTVSGQIHTVLVDQGYDNTEQIAQVEREEKLLVLCPAQRRPNTKPHNPKRRGHRQWTWQQRRPMEQRLRCPLLRALYRRRQPSAEVVFARIKSHLGFRRGLIA
jgi:Transposase DDE domain